MRLWLFQTATGFACQTLAVSIMTRQSIIFILTILSLKIIAQTSTKCNCSALVDPKYTDNIIVFDKPDGKPIKELKNNIKDQNNLTLTIDKDSSIFFHVAIGFALTDNSNLKGWVKKSNVIGIYARNYNDTLLLFSKPDLKSKINSTIPNWTNQLYVIDKCYNDWVFVTIKYKGQIKKGWLQPDKQCSSPYTTCN